MAEEAESSKAMISLKTFDGKIFEALPAIVRHMETVQSFITEDESFNASSVIPLPNVNSFALSKIIDYLDYHHRFRDGKAVSGATDEEAKEFNAEFVKQLSKEELMELLLVANYLDVKELLSFLSQTIADLIQNKSVEFVREYFGIVSDYTPEEEAKYREENEWAFRGVDEDRISNSLSDWIFI